MAIETTWKDKKFGVGDVVSVYLKLIEGGKERVQAFRGVVLGIRGSGADKTFCVRKEGAGGIGIERIFPLASPWIDDIKVEQKAVRVRRAKLYYLRTMAGKEGLRKIYKVKEDVGKQKKRGGRKTASKKGSKK